MLSRSEAHLISDARGDLAGDVQRLAVEVDVLPLQGAELTAPCTGNGNRYVFVVTAAAETLLEQALTLPPEDRASLASGQLASLDSESVEDAEVDRLWSAETERRATMLASGEARLVTWDHLVSRIDERRA